VKSEKVIRIVGIRDLTFAWGLPKRNNDATNITLNLKKKLFNKVERLYVCFDTACHVTLATMKQYAFDPFTLHIEVRIVTHDVLSSCLCKSYNTHGAASSLSQQELLHCDILH